MQRAREERTTEDATVVFYSKQIPKHRGLGTKSKTGKRNESDTARGTARKNGTGGAARPARGARRDACGTAFVAGRARLATVRETRREEQNARGVARATRLGTAQRSTANAARRGIARPEAWRSTRSRCRGDAHATTTPMRHEYEVRDATTLTFWSPRMTSNGRNMRRAARTL